MALFSKNGPTGSAPSAKLPPTVARADRMNILATDKQVQRAKEEAAAKRKRTLIIGAVVLGVLALATVFVLWLVGGEEVTEDQQAEIIAPNLQLYLNDAYVEEIEVQVVPGAKPGIPSTLRIVTEGQDTGCKVANLYDLSPSGPGLAELRCPGNRFPFTQEDRVGSSAP